MGNKKFRGKYRIESTRLKNYDYASNGAYFITIVAKNRFHYFGEIVKGKMILNDLGKIVWDEWLLSEKIRNHIFLDEFVIMPNHFHGIVIINNDAGDGNDDDHGDGRDVLQNVSTTVVATTSLSSSTKKQKNKYYSKISPSTKSLSVMIRSFKSAVTRKSSEISPNFGWQSRFHDRIIRDGNELDRVRKYIIDNPKMWQPLYEQ